MRERIKHRDNRIRIITWYTVLYAVAAVSYYLLIHRHFGKTLVQRWDALHQYYPFLVYLRSFYRECLSNWSKGHFAVRMFDLNLGFGFDTIKYLTYYGLCDILNWPVVLVKEGHALRYYEGLILLRPYLAGFTFLTLCFHFDRRTIMTIAGAFVYISGGYAIHVMITHPLFMNLLIYLPLFIIGVDRIIQGGKPYLWMASVFLCALTGFYFLYMVSVLALFYAIIRVITVNKRNEHKIRSSLEATGKAAAAYVAAVGLAMFSFLPSVAGFFESGRSVSSFQTSLFSISVDRIWLFLQTLLGTQTGFGTISVPAVSLLALICAVSRKRNTEIKLLTLLCLLLYILPIGAYVLSGFSTTVQRWTFAIVLLVAFTVVDLPEYLVQIKGYELVIWLACIGLFSYRLLRGGNLSKPNQIHIGVIVLAFFIIAAAFVWCCTVKKPSANIMTVVSFLTVCIGVAANWGHAYSPSAGNEPSRLSAWPAANSVNEGTYGRTAELTKDVESGRYTSDSFQGCNTAAVQAVPATAAYGSIIPSSVYTFFYQMENRMQTTPYSPYGVDNRIGLMSLLSTKYLTASVDSDMRIPTGLEAIGEIKEGIVYENVNALSLGFTYDTVLSEEAFESLDAVSKEQAMLQAVYMPAYEAGQDRVAPDLTGITDVPYEMTAKAGIEWDGKTLNVYDKEAYMDISSKLPTNAAVYLYFPEIYSNSIAFSAAITYANEDSIAFSTRAGNDEHYYGQTSCTVFAEHTKENEEKRVYRIHFYKTGSFTFEAPQLLAVKTAYTTNVISERQEETMQDVVLKLNQITGTISAADSKYLYLSIPYQKGWRIYVDGRSVPVYQANLFGMAVEITPGTHEITCVYRTPFLSYGIIISVLSALGVAVCGFVKKYTVLSK